MNIKQELQQINNKLDKTKRKLAAAERRGDKVVSLQAQAEIEALNKALDAVQTQKNRQLNDEGARIKALAFSRELSKEEQADMGKLKKSVKGLVVVHPLTALGRDLGVSKVTGFADKPF